MRALCNSLVPTVRLLRLRHIEFAEAEVAQCNVPGIVEQDVFRFQVAEPGDE